MHRFLVLVLAGVGAFGPSIASAQVPEKFTNLQVLPKTITQAELVPIMRGFALNLGIRCQHCHVGEGNDLSKFDFAADTKPPKLVARRMLKMVAVLNEQVAGIGEPAPAGSPKITCFTCHRGATKPLTAPGGGGGGRGGSLKLPDVTARKPNRPDRSTNPTSWAPLPSLSFISGLSVRQ